MPGIFPPPVGPTYVFKNISSKRISGGQNGIPILDPGEEFSLVESQLRSIHPSLVEEGMLSVEPALPPDLDVRGLSLNWRDGEFRKVMAMAKDSETQIVFAADAPATGVVGEAAEIAIQVQDAAGVVNQTDSDEEVDITVAGDDVETEVADEEIVTVPGGGSAGPFAATLAQTPVVPGTLVITAGAVVGQDDGAGNITGIGIAAGAIDYETGEITGLTYDAPVAEATVITADYSYVAAEGVAGSIVAVTGYVSTIGPNVVRAKFSSGVIIIKVTSAAAGVQTLSLSNPKTAALDVSDTHVITWS